MLTGVIIGFGEIAAHGHWPAYASSSELRVGAVVDRSEARRALARSLDPSLRTFATFEELCASTFRPDFVDICTPPALHAEPLLAAARCGWHVVCEKPFLLDPAAVEQARELAAARRVALVPVHNWKYAPIVRAATASLAAGTIGALQSIHIETTRVQAAATADGGAPNWRRNPDLAGGGILMDHGWHAVYLALHWFAEPATSVRCVLQRSKGSVVEDDVALEIGFAGGSATVALTWKGTARRNLMTLEGTKGRITIDDSVLRVSGAEIAPRVFEPALSEGSHHPEWFAAMLPDVAAWFRNPVSSRPVFEEAASCLAIIREAYQCGALLAMPPR